MLKRREIRRKEATYEVKETQLLLSAKNLYLTYSNCDLGLEKVINLLKGKLSNYIVQEWVRMGNSTGTSQQWPKSSSYLYKDIEKNTYKVFNILGYSRRFRRISRELSKCKKAKQCNRLHVEKCHYKKRP